MFINLIVNSSGMYMTIWTTVGHGEMLTFSDQKDQDILPAVHKYKVLDHDSVLRVADAARVWPRRSACADGFIRLTVCSRKR